MIELCYDCSRDTEKDDFDNDDGLVNDGTDDREASESKPLRKKKSEVTTKKTCRTNIKTRQSASTGTNFVIYYTDIIIAPPYRDRSPQNL